MFSMLRVSEAILAIQAGRPAMAMIHADSTLGFALKSESSLSDAEHAHGADRQLMHWVADRMLRP